MYVKGFFQCSPVVWKNLNDKHNNCKFYLCYHCSACFYLFTLFIQPSLYRRAYAGCPSPDALLDPLFKEVDTFSKNDGSKRGKIAVANKHIVDALTNMDKWITKGN